MNVVTRFALLGMVLLSVGATAPSTQSSSSSSSRRASYSDRFGLLEDRNIFVRERTSRRNGDRTSGPSTAPAPRPPEERLVLTGIVIEDDGFRAYVENDRGEVLRLAPGDKVARGHVVAFVLDAMAYEATSTGNATTAPTTTVSTTAPTPGNRVWVEIGFDLTGKESTLFASSSYSSSSSSSSSSSATTSPTTGPVALPADLAGKSLNDPTLTVEQRMRLRSALERQQK
jgi:hypothetical protein